jgi:hypothetical protein
MPTKTMTPYQVAVAAEAFAACVLAHAGTDVSIQYSANQPGHDLVATRGRRALKVSVKGSQDGGWGLIQSYKGGASYAQAADRWCADQDEDVVFCLVQFEGVPVGGAPRIYFAWPREIADHLKSSRAGHGHTILYEDYTMKKGVGAGFTNKLPVSWAVSAQKIEDLFR